MMVSVVMITYNHESCIEEAVNGVLMQQCTFDIELIIANDTSKDDTHKIINQIIATHPKSGRIRYFSNEKNKGMMQNFSFALQQARGRYTALCEGDDFWTDPLKLEKQVQFMESHPECSLSLHNGFIYQEDKEAYSNFCIPLRYINRNYLNEEYLFKCRGVLAPTASFMFRTALLDSECLDFIHASPVGDTPLLLMMNLKGKIGVLKEKMSVYRVCTTNGSWTSNSRNVRFLLEFTKKKEQNWLEYNRISKFRHMAFTKRAIGVQYSNYIYGLGKFASKVEQVRNVFKYKERLYPADFLYLIPRILFKINRIF